MDNKLCPGVRDTESLVGPTVRLSVRSDERPPDKCIAHINVLNAIIDALNTSVVVTYQPLIGREGPNSWNGVIGDLVGNHSDVGVGTFTATYERFRLVRLSPALGYGCPIAFLSGKRFQNRSHFQVMRTFTSELWVMVVVAIVAIGVVDGSMHCRLQRVCSTVAAKTFLHFGLFLSQSSKAFDRICCVRHLALLSIGFVSFLLLTQTFDSKILSQVLHEPYTYVDSIDDLVTLIKQTNVSLIAHRTHLTWHLLQSHEDPRFKMVFDRLEDRTVDYHEVVAGKAIYINYGDILQYLLSATKTSDLHLSDERYFGSPLVVLYSKHINETLKSRLDSVVNILFESGLEDYWSSLKYKALRLTNEKANHRAITFNSISGLIVLFGSIVVALIIFFTLELACANFRII